jgi:hypothetical protein
LRQQVGHAPGVKKVGMHPARACHGKYVHHIAQRKLCPSTTGQITPAQESGRYPVALTAPMPLATQFPKAHGVTSLERRAGTNAPVSAGTQCQGGKRQRRRADHGKPQVKRAVASSSWPSSTHRGSRGH